MNTKGELISESVQLLDEISDPEVIAQAEENYQLRKDSQKPICRPSLAKEKLRRKRRDSDRPTRPMIPLRDLKK